MEPRDEIYNGGQVFQESPIALATLSASGGGNDPVDVLFANFVGYAAANWTYNAVSGTTSDGLLAGTGGTMPACATIAGAFKQLVEEKIPGSACSDAKLEGHNARFLVKPGLKCFDRRVVGNVGNYGARADHEFNVGTYFGTHYFCKVGNKFYDPCLMATYASLEGPIWKKSRPFMPSLGHRNPAMVKIGTGRQLIVLMVDTTKQVPGFGSTFQILQPKECKRVLDAPGLTAFKNDPDVRAGQFF